MSIPSHAANAPAIDLAWVRAQFPALKMAVNGHPATFLDGPAGTQVPQRVIDAMADYLANSNANTCGAFATSRRSDAIIAEAHSAMADFLGCDAAEVHFGANMTTLTFAFSRAFGRELKAGDEIVITTLDHDANVAPWRALEERGAVIRQVDIREVDCSLDMDDLRKTISSRTKLVAVGYAANAVGTINDVQEIVRLAHAAGALAFVDAVHYAPHGPVDVRALNCDFLACSPYKFFGPHSGVIYGKSAHMLRMRSYKVRPQHDTLPDRWETGTLAHEALAGVGAAIEYLADLGRRAVPSAESRRAAVLAAYKTIQAHERSLMEKLIGGLLKIRGLKFYGITDPAQFHLRVPTVAIRIAEKTPLELATALGDRGIFTWDGNYFALNLTERLGVENDGGFLRIGCVHYNTPEEVDRLLAALQEIS
ncbi:MAG: cysteine desulfurase-like protein [Acidobacteria bacterium]|nr:cysteine desulfurase-like protein [Acidobacteriota bacterium]